MEFDGYYIGKELGRGAFGVVNYGWNEKDKQEVAIKKIEKKHLNDKNFTREIKILQEVQNLNNENLVMLLKYEERANYVLLVMDYCNHGDLAQYMIKKKTLNEATIRHFFAQIANALEALNSKSILHRDLKPQNILLCNPCDSLPMPTDLIVKLADFGLSRLLPEGIMASTRCGSPMYMAPEVILSHHYGAKTNFLWSMAVAVYQKLSGKSCQYGNKSDLWSLGVTMYQCLNGTVPFMPEAKSFSELKMFYEENTKLAPKISDSTSLLLSDLLNGLLRRNPSDRIEYTQLFTHPFFHTTENFPNGSEITLIFERGEPNEAGIYQAKLEGYKREEGSVPFPIPIASFPPPNYTGFEKIDINFLDGRVMQCIEHIYPKLNFNSMGIRRFDLQICNSTEQINHVRRLIEMLVQKTTSLFDENLFDLQFNPNMYGLIENVQIIRGIGPTDEDIDFDLLFRWLIIPRIDRKPKLLEFHDAKRHQKFMLIKRIKEHFIGSTQFANFLISFNWQSADYPHFTTENELTGEVLALYTMNMVYFAEERQCENERQFLVRHAKGEEHLRANWEKLSEIDYYPDVYIHIQGIGEF